MHVATLIYSIKVIFITELLKRNLVRRYLFSIVIGVLAVNSRTAVDDTLA